MKLNENTVYQSLWHTTKTVLREKFVTVNIYMKKEQNLK